MLVNILRKKRLNSKVFALLFTIGVHVVDAMTDSLLALENFDPAKKFLKLQKNLRSKG